MHSCDDQHHWAAIYIMRIASTRTSTRTTSTSTMSTTTTAMTSLIEGAYSRYSIRRLY